ncbi:MAG: SpoIID/LytB domain-containing protein [Acidobacteria bacterium]|nr:SpoIID/LytB domain-containing protein [Acidobacteriota bacterium]
MTMRRLVSLMLLITWFGMAPFPSAGQQRRRPLRVTPQERKGAPEIPAGKERGPSIRIALLGDVMSFTLSSAGPIARVTDERDGRALLGDKELRIVLSKPPAHASPVFTVEIPSVEDRKSAEKLSKQLGRQYHHSSTIAEDVAGRKLLVRVGRFTSQGAAAVFVDTLKKAGHPRARVIRQPAPKSTRPALLAVSEGGEPSARSSDSLAFVSFTDAPLRVNGTAYRGRIEARLNSRNTLVVVNELPLEDYLLGVVPNELSPTHYPEIEALKAQAIAARTYAIRNLGKYRGEGFDLYADARSQVYGGKESEQPLSSRAVVETAGLVLTYDAEPIDAVYTSTCGGRTENAEVIFARPLPYLRSVLCSPEKDWIARHELPSRRKPYLERELAWLEFAALELPREVSSGFLSGKPSEDQIQDWLGSLAQLLGRRPSSSSKARAVSHTRSEPGGEKKAVRFDIGKWYGFAQLLADGYYPDGYVELMLSDQDINYLLDFPDSADLPSAHRAAFAMLLRDGLIGPTDEGAIKPKANLTRREALFTLARILERSGALQFESGVVRHFRPGVLTVRQDRIASRALDVDGQAYLYRKVGTACLPVPRLTIVGGERVRFHLNRNGAIDYLEAEVAPNGLASDRFSPLSRWEQKISRSDLMALLKKSEVDVGQLLDLKPSRMGQGRRVAELEVVGTRATKVLKGSSIRNALGLRENMFVIDRRYDEQRRVTDFIFFGRGWGHGVGLCQMGAYGLALEGANAERILKSYYTGAELAKRY